MWDDNKYDGGSVFPGQTDRFGASQGNGLTRRDWFAGMALAGFCAAPTMSSQPSDVVEDAYQLADMMLEEGL